MCLRTEGRLCKVQIVRARVPTELKQAVVRMLRRQLLLLAPPHVEVVDGDAGGGVAVAVEQVLETGHQSRLAAALWRGNADLQTRSRVGM